MSMHQIEQGFRTIDNALKNGQFKKHELEFIIMFCQTVMSATQKVLDKITPPNSDNVEAVEQPLTGDKTAEALPDGDITPDCGKCSVSSGCDLPLGGKVCIQHFTPA